MQPNPEAFGTLRNVPSAVATARLRGSVLLCDHRGGGLVRGAAALRQRGWTVLASTSMLESRRALDSSIPDALVLDPSIEGGAAEIAELDQYGASGMPVLLCADPEHMTEAVAVWSATPGRVLDIVHRGADPVEVDARLQHLALQSARRVELGRLRHRANYDDRTELLRPEAFEHRLMEHWSAAVRHDLPLALVVADLDRFGQFNKRYDHTVGDRVLTGVGEAVRSALRTEDVAGRLGGDEFAVILPYTNRSDAARVARRLCTAIRDVVVEVGGASLHTSASLGFESRESSDIDSPQALRLHAENALREAKRRGGNRELDYRWLPAALGA